MEFSDKEKYSNTSGIYYIKNLINDMIYVGQTCQPFKKRYWLHCWNLRKNQHSNTNLQEEYNKFGEKSFEFGVLEIVKDNNLLDAKEQEYISFYKKQNKSYNISNGGGVRRDFTVSEDTKKKIGKKNKEKNLGKKHSSETIKKMAKTRTGQPYTRYKKTTKATDNLIRTIKEKLVAGEKGADIARELSVDYKIVNNVLSNNTWSNIKVNGWDEFQEKRERVHPPSIQALQDVYEKYTFENISKKELGKKYHRHPKTIEGWIKKYEKILQDNPVPSLSNEKGQTTIP